MAAAPGFPLSGTHAHLRLPLAGTEAAAVVEVVEVSLHIYENTDPDHYAQCGCEGPQRYRVVLEHATFTAAASPSRFGRSTPVSYVRTTEQALHHFPGHDVHDQWRTCPRTAMRDTTEPVRSRASPAPVEPLALRHGQGVENVLRVLLEERTDLLDHVVAVYHQRRLAQLEHDIDVYTGLIERAREQAREVDLHAAAHAIGDPDRRRTAYRLLASGWTGTGEDLDVVAAAITSPTSPTE